MKKHLLLLWGGLILPITVALAQPFDNTPPPNSGAMPQLPTGYILVKDTNSLTKFNLDFPGGTPAELVKTIETATGKPLNTVILDEYANRKLPALSVKNVTVDQLFAALENVTTKFERFAWTDYMLNLNRDPQTSSPVTYYYNWTYRCGFKTDGTPTDNSIWCFFCDEPAVQHDPTICRFYQLAPYLEAGYKLEDITTTIETGWKMLGITHLPEMSFHKDTKVLIAVGEADKLKTIEDVLKQLSTTPKPKPNDKDLPKSKDQ